MTIKGNIQDAEQLLRLLNSYDRYLQVFDKSTYIQLADLANALELKLDRALTDLKDEDFSNSFKDEIKKKGFNTDKIEVYSV
jgi:hypothetical protein